MTNKTIDQYVKEFEVDSTITLINMAEMSMKHSVIHSKWLYRKYEHLNRIKILQRKLEDYIEQTTNNELKSLGKISVTALNSKISKTETAREITKQIEDEELTLDWIIDALKLLTNTAYNYKNLVEFAKLEYFGQV